MKENGALTGGYAVREENRRMKRRIQAALCIGMLLTGLLTGCGESTGQKESGDTARSTETYTDKDHLKQAGLGGLAMLYDDSVWMEDTAQEADNSLAFEDGNGSVLGISASRESVYQHPLDMISMSRQIYATYEGYEEIEEPTLVEVQGENWYEWSYRYTENGSDMETMQRFYARNYYAYTVSYVAAKDSFEAGKTEALKVMNSIVMNVPDNAEAEAKAREFLVGEWDLGDSGYLVLNDDGTYEWYMMSDKDEKNMHRGVYGCDVENQSLGFSEGEGIYLVLFPEVLYVDGEQQTTSNAKYDYGISLQQQEDGSYQMMNVSTFVIYSMMKQ